MNCEHERATIRTSQPASWVQATCPECGEFWTGDRKQAPDWVCVLLGTDPRGGSQPLPQAKSEAAGLGSTPTVPTISQ